MPNKASGTRTPRDYSDVYTERWAAEGLTEFIEELCPNVIARQVALQRVAESIQSAHRLRPDRWGLSDRQWFMRLNFGNMEALIWVPSQLRLMVDVPSLRKAGSIGELAPYLLQTPYKTAPNSRYASFPTDDSGRLTDLVQLAADAHRRHLEITSESSINGQTRAQHHPGLVDALGRLAGIALPQPSYVTVARPASLASSAPLANDDSHDDDPLLDFELAKDDLDSVSETERQALCQARLGQGPFRRSLDEYWGTCAVTGIGTRAALRASHMKPWRNSSNAERLDQFNGLLLVANLDALFDRGLISFSTSGDLLCSSRLSMAERSRLGISGDMRLRRIERKHVKYLEYHQKVEFKP